MRQRQTPYVDMNIRSGSTNAEAFGCLPYHILREASVVVCSNSNGQFQGLKSQERTADVALTLLFYTNLTSSSESGDNLYTGVEMKEYWKRIDQREGLAKYQNGRLIIDGYEQLVRVSDDGTEDPSCWNMNYTNAQKKKEAEKSQSEEKSNDRKAKKSSKSSGNNGYFGMSKWNPICWIIWIVLLPFKIVWAILKFVLKIFGIWAIINFFSGSDD